MHKQVPQQQVGKPWVDKFGRRRVPSQTFVDDRGKVTYGQAAIAAMTAHINVVQLKRREALRLLAPANGHAPREARNDRVRGSKRGERSTSSSSDDPDPEPAPAERRCENERCGADLSGQHALRRYCDDACQQQAYRDRQLAAQLDALTGTRTFRVSCRCRPKRALVVDGCCFHCGRPRGAVTLAWEREPAAHARSFVFTHALKRKPPRLGDRKRRPVTVIEGVVAM
jgi:hypothetical protein